MIPLLESKIGFDDSNNVSVYFKALHPNLKTTEYARFTFLFYAKMLFNIPPEEYWASSAYQFLFDATNQIAKTELSKKMDILEISDIDDVLTLSESEIKKYKFTSKLFFISENIRTIETSLPINLGWTMQQMTYTIPIFIAGAIRHCDISDIQIIQIGLKYMNYKYEKDIMCGKPIDLIQIPIQAYMSAILNEDFNIHYKYIFHKCEGCSKELKIVRGKGKIKERCPNCQREFTIDTF